jgi:predicted secreted protein
MTRKLCAALALLACGCAFAAAPEPARPGVTVIELSAEAARTAPNDLAQASAYAEATDADPAELAHRINLAIAAALKTAKAYPAVRTRTGASHTYPTTGKSGRIEGWRMRSEILLETRDAAALSELLGKLQSNLAVGQIVLQPAPETRRRVEDEAALDAIGAFRARAKLIADAFGKPYRIRQIAIHTSGRPPILPVMRGAMMAEAAAAPAPPIETGESTITVTINGQIEVPAE